MPVLLSFSLLTRLEEDEGFMIVIRHQHYNIAKRNIDFFSSLIAT